MVNIVEIITRSDQGITRPFLCRGDNGLQYYVKGNAAGKKALIAEWIAGNLGKKLGLPIPDFQLVKVPTELIRLSARDDATALGAGVGFGSQRVESVDELSYLFINQIPGELRAKILLFDWWICNGDRTLTADGGNPNLLWLHRTQRLYVIDQNVAFDDNEVSGFWDEHIFHSDITQWSAEFQASMTTLMRNALSELPKWWNEMPAEWTEVDTGLSLNQITSLLWRFQDKPSIFWRVQ